MNLQELEGLIGRTVPPGRYRIDRDAHAKMIGAVHASDYESDVAHPVYAHLAPHCGMGWKIDEFFDVAGFPMDGGALYGEGELTYHQPMLIDTDYVVQGHIEAVQRKHGTRTGTFDVITLLLNLVDESGMLIVTSRETYVLPRAENGSR
ncbi:MAG: FAS1-like dehydratase domain-containing protein [Acidimicrobiales bacterium]